MKTACPTGDLLAQFLDESLASDRHAGIAAHVDACPLCQETLDQMTAEPTIFMDGESTCGTHELPTHRREQLREALRVRESAGELPVASAVLFAKRAAATGGLGGGAVAGSVAAAKPDRLRFPQPPTEDAPLGSLGPYRILEQVACGAHGLLFKARDSRLNRTVAIKVLRGEIAVSERARARFQREAQLAASLRHDHIVTVFEVGNEAGFPPYLVMEYVDGGTLADRLHRRGPLKPREAAGIVVQIASALDGAARQGLVHRDVKPSNILFDSSLERAKIADFGLARGAEGASDLTAEGQIAGTPAYMSPEQIATPDDVDPRTDVYSLGVVLYEMLTGEPPFRGVVRTTLLRVLHEDPRPPRQLNDRLPRDLETICLKALAKDRGRRYQSPAELADDVRRWLQGEPIHARPVGAGERAIGWCRRNPKVAVLSGLVFTLLIGVAVSTSVASIRLAYARDQAERHATAARQQRDAALETLQKLVFDVQDEFEKDTVDLDELQKTVLDVAVDGLRRIARSTGDTAAVDYSTAVALNRLGETLSRLEQVDEAERQYLRARTIASQLLARDPRDRDARQIRMQVEFNLGDVAFDNDDLSGMRSSYQEALRISQSLAADAPRDVQVLCDQARAHSNLGDVASLEGELDEARAQYERSRHGYQAAAAAGPLEGDAYFDLLDNLEALSELYEELDERALVEDVKHELRQRLEQRLAVSGPGRPDPLLRGYLRRANLMPSANPQRAPRGG